MDKNRSILITILAILLLQLFVSISNEFRFYRLENNIQEYITFIEDDASLPNWEEPK